MEHGAKLIPKCINIPHKSLKNADRNEWAKNNIQKEPGSTMEGRFAHQCQGTLGSNILIEIYIYIHIYIYKYFISFQDVRSRVTFARGLASRGEKWRHLTLSFCQGLTVTLYEFPRDSRCPMSFCVQPRAKGAWPIFLTHGQVSLARSKLSSSPSAARAGEGGVSAGLWGSQSHCRLRLRPAPDGAQYVAAASR